MPTYRGANFPNLSILGTCPEDWKVSPAMARRNTIEQVFEKERQR